MQKTPRNFTDSKNRSWTVSVNVNTIRRVRDMTTIDLMGIADNQRDETNLVFRLAVDPVLLIDVLYAVLKPQLDTASVTPEEFGGECFETGDALNGANDALMEATIDFFPSQKQKGLRAVLAKLKGAESRMEIQALQVIEGGELDQLIEAELARLKLPGSLSGNSPASPESIQAS